MNTGFSFQITVKKSGILRTALAGKALLAEVHVVCTSKGDDARLGAGKHKPIWIKGFPMV